MTKYKKLCARLLEGIGAAFGRRFCAFSNIAEGTHAGSITMTAEEAVDQPNLVVKAGASDGGFSVAGVADKPLGICSDEGAAGDKLAVLLPGSAESTMICRAAGSVNAGESVYTAANGKVSSAAADGSYKIGVALCSAASGGVVEVDPQGFGESAWQFYACGIHTWYNDTASSTLGCSGLNEGDVVIASVQSAGSSEKTVKASADSAGITFTLDSAGKSGSTKISWIAIRKN